MADIADSLTKMLLPVVTDLGFDLVRVTFGGGGRRATLQVMAERPDGSMTVDDCAELSREISAYLDVEDPIKGEFVLEVSSPGVDRPLTRRKDFIRWIGFDAKIELKDVIEDRRRFRGRLVSLEGDCLTIDSDGEQIELSFDDISKAKLILTDDLLTYVAEKRQGDETGEMRGQETSSARTTPAPEDTVSVESGST